MRGYASSLATWQAQPTDLAARVVANRFLRLDARRVLDLAFGSLADLRFVETRVGHQGAWLDRGAALSALHHPHLLELVDYDLIGPARGFEAYPVTAPGPAVPDKRSAAAVRAIVEFLAGQGLNPGRADWRRVRTLDRGIVLLPDADTGTPASARAPCDPPDAALAWNRRLAAWPRRASRRTDGFRRSLPAALGAVAEALEHGRPGEPKRLHVHARPGAGLPTVLAAIAREARRRGYVPLHLSLARAWPSLVVALADRHVVLIDDERRSGRVKASAAVSAGASDPEGCGHPLIALGARSARAHMLLVVSSGVECPPDALCLDAPPEYASPNADTRTCAVRYRSASARAARVRESTASYGAAHPIDTAVSPVVPASVPRRPGEVTVPHQRAAQEVEARAVALVGSGRHAAAVRLLRATMAGFYRRRDDASAARLAMRLATLLLARGRTTEALSLLEQARKSGSADVSLQAALGMGAAWTDEGRLAEAEAMLRTALIVAGEQRDDEAVLSATLGLARCLFWQGRYDDAAAALAGTSTRDRTAAWWARKARIDLARLALPEAGRAAAKALEAAEASADTGDRCRAHLALAAVQTVVADREGFVAHVRAALDAARRGHAPLRVVYCRVFFIEGSRQLGGPQEGCHLRWLQRLQPLTLPALLRARVQLVQAELADSADRRQALRSLAETFVRTSGAHGLAASAPGTPPAVVREISEVLRICHEADTEHTALERVCVSVRDRLRARSAVLVAGDAGDTRLAGAGTPWANRSPAVTRAVSSGLMIPPMQVAIGIEAAAPVRYGGRVVGVLACRWSIGTVVDAARVLELLSAAAAACAPSVRARLDSYETAPLSGTTDAPALLGTSHAIETVRRAVARAASTPFPVLIEGESGTGKELVARAIHAAGLHRHQRFCAINCAALPDDLVEAELFGHARGVFTGAIADRPGLFEDADRGTLLLDEVSELTPRAQAKLLRVIQEGEVRRIGESFARHVEVRLVTATNRSLDAEVAGGRFRADLRYRLDVLRIVVPPLRERTEDVPLLAAHFWREAAGRIGSRATLAPETMVTLARYDWPGNVRELQNLMASLAVMASRRGRVGPQELPETIARVGSARSAVTLEAARCAFERRFVRAALARAGGHRMRAATELGLTRQGFAKLLKRLSLDPQAG